MKKNEAQKEEGREVLKNEIFSLKEEVRSLKLSLGGYKTSNGMYKKQISDLNEKLEEKERVIYGLQDQISDVNKRITSNEKHIASLSNERDIAVANYEYVCSLPWYQRIFFKGK